MKISYTFCDLLIRSTSLQFSIFAELNSQFSYCFFVRKEHYILKIRYLKSFFPQLIKRISVFAQHSLHLTNFFINIINGRYSCHFLKALFPYSDRCRLNVGHVFIQAVSVAWSIWLWYWRLQKIRLRKFLRFRGVNLVSFPDFFDEFQLLADDCGVVSYVQVLFGFYILNKLLIFIAF